MNPLFFSLAQAKGSETATESFGNSMLADISSLGGSLSGFSEHVPFCFFAFYAFTSVLDIHLEAIFLS